MDTKNHFSDCGFGERLVSYIYDEAGDAERTAVESHLSSCVACADEFAALSGVQFAISDWKTSEFDVLPTPAISIPYSAALEPRTVSADAPVTWLSALRKLFTLSPAWSLAAASIAVFALVGAVIFFSLNNRGSDMAGVSNTKVTPSPSATRVIADPKVSPSPFSNPKMTNDPATPTTPASKEQPKLVSGKPTPRQPVRVASTSGFKKSGARQPKPGARDQETALPDTEEDDSLRLAELFEEIGMR